MITNSKFWYKLLCVWAAGNRVLHLWPGHSGGKTNDRRRKSDLTLLQFYVKTIAAIQSVHKLERRSHPRLSCWWEQADQLPLGVHSRRTPPSRKHKKAGGTDSKDIHLLILHPLKSLKMKLWLDRSTITYITSSGSAHPAWPIVSTLADFTWRCTAQNLPLVCYDTPNMSHMVVRVQERVRSKAKG